MRAVRYLLVLVAFAGCGDGLSLGIPGCGSMVDRPFVRTPENTLDRAVRAAVTSEGVRFLVDRREALAAALFDVDEQGHARLPLAEPFSFLDPEAGLGGEVRDVVVDFDLRRVELDLEFVSGQPPAIRLHVRNARVGLDGAVISVTVGGDAACRLRDGLFVGTPDEALIVADVILDIRLAITPDGRFEAQVEIFDYTIHELGIELEHDPALPECNDGISDAECPILCRLADAGADLGEALRDAIQGQLDLLLRPLVQRFVDDLLRRYTGKAVYVEGEAHPRALEALLPVAIDAHPFRFRVGPSPEGFQVRATGDAADGLDLTVDLGLEADDHPCVPATDPLPALALGRPPVLTGREADGDVYHLGLSVAEALLNRSLWVAYRAGVLCLTLDTDALLGLVGQRIDSAALGLLLAGVDELTDSTPRPVMIVLDPAFTAADFPLLSFEPARDVGVPQAAARATMRNVGVSFYLFLEERWSRVFQGRVDVGLSFAISATPDNRLAISVDPPAVENLTETYNEHLASADIPGLLQLMVDVATRVLIRDGLSFDVGLDGLISEVTGLSLDARITGLETEGGFLNVLMALVDAPAGGAAIAAVETRVLEARHDPGRGRVELGVEGGTSYQWRVDVGPWRTLRRAPEGRLSVDDPLLRVLGPHLLEVRAVGDDYRSLDPTPAEVSLVTAPTGPAPEPAAGCSAAPGGGSAALWILVLAARARRRRR